MTALNATAKSQLLAAGVTQAEWARANYMTSGRWSGDVCGCPDDRCIGFHHVSADNCGCLPTLLGDYLDQVAGSGGFHIFAEVRRKRGTS